MTRLRVTEAFKGVKSEYVEVGQVLGFQIQLALGKECLVFADWCGWDDAEKDYLAAGMCSGTHTPERLWIN